jgi:hypothetical protein
MSPDVFGHLIGGGGGNIRYILVPHPSGLHCVQFGSAPGVARRTRTRVLIYTAQTKKGHPKVTFILLVEAAGIEPASANPLPQALHA